MIQPHAMPIADPLRFPPREPRPTGRAPGGEVVDVPTTFLRRHGRRGPAAPRRAARPRAAAARLLAGPAALLALAGCVAAAPAPEPRRTPPPAGSTTEARALAERVNRHRQSRGLHALVWDERIAAVARRHSEDMARRGYFSHETPEGVDPFERLRRAGIEFRAAAENIGEGDGGGERMLRGWLASPGHRANLESQATTHHGIGRSGRFWTHVFVRPARAPR